MKPPLLFADTCCRDFFWHDFPERFCDRIQKIHASIVLRIIFDFVYDESYALY